MMTRKKCIFCGRDIMLGRGIMLVRNDGRIQYFCSSKCRKNALFLRRDPRRFKWTQHYVKKSVREAGPDTGSDQA